MFTLIIIALEVINMAMLVKLMKAGNFVRVEEKHIYVPAKKKKVRVPVESEIVDYDE